MLRHDARFCQEVQIELAEAAFAMGRSKSKIVSCLEECEGEEDKRILYGVCIEEELLVTEGVRFVGTLPIFGRTTATVSAGCPALVSPPSTSHISSTT